MRKLVCGVGVNDSDCPVTVWEVVEGKYRQAGLCPFYQAWRCMLQRCYSEAFRVRKKSYAGCSVAKDWHRLSSFKAWMQTQDWEGKQLDKDLLIPGNKIYSPETCVFVSQRLNLFLSDRAASRGKWPIGVSVRKDTVAEFQVRCSNPFSGKDEHLGMFDTPEEAHEAWRQKKHEHACRYADMQTDPRIAQALRTRFAQ